MLVNCGTHFSDKADKFNGRKYGELSDEEQEIVDRLIKKGKLEKRFEGVSGFMGLSTLRRPCLKD